MERKKRTRIDVARDIFDSFLKDESSRRGVAISDCRGKETMVVTRYGGDILVSFYDLKTNELKFVFVLEMNRNCKKNWNQIFEYFVRIKQLVKNNA